jgi:hypothetical protein
VKLTVNIVDLELSAEEQQRIVVLVGPRYDLRKNRLILNSERFPNRVENKRLARVTWGTVQGVLTGSQDFQYLEIHTYNSHGNCFYI